MPKIQWSGFRGESRAPHPKLLPEAVGVLSRNQKPGRGDLRPWRQPLTVATVPSGRKTIYRMGRDVSNDTNYWLTWPTVVHAIRGFSADDTTERTFYTGDGAPKVTDNLMALASAPYPTTGRPMGIPAPIGALMVTVADPTLSVLQAGQPARTETVVAPRVITQIKVADLASGFFTLVTVRLVTVWMNSTDGLSAGALSNTPPAVVQCVEFPSINTANASIFQIAEDYISYRVSSSVPLQATTPATGTVTTAADTVSFPQIDEVIQSPETLGLRQTRFYTYTYVNDWGWESAPAPVSNQVNAFPASTTTISGFAPAPPGNYAINRIRIYRTQTGSSGNTDFFLLREIPLGVATTQDDNRVLGEPLPTLTWLQAPSDLSHLTALWNGMAAGISDGGVRFCEAYVPYAWPIAYDVIPPDSKPVALGVFGQSLLVLTNGRPLLVSGTGPDSMDQMPLEFSQACAAPDSVVGMGAGVAWASEDGLCWYGSGGARILTAGLMTRDDWQALNPASIIGQMYEGLYFGSYDDGAGRKGFFIDPTNPTGLYFMDAGHESMHFDELQDQLYVLSGGNVQRWDGGATPMTVRARSKVFRAPAPMNFACAEVVADSYPVTLRLYADGVLRHTQTVTRRDPFWLPSGYMALDWQMEIETTGAVQGCVLATSMQELANS